MTDPFADREERDELRVTTTDGRVIVGSYMRRGSLSFLLEKSPSRITGTNVVGPLRADEACQVEVLATKAEVIERARAAWLGELVPGPAPVTRDDHEVRLRRIARLMAQTKESDWARYCELERQFRALADTIALAAGKREWVIREEAWYARGRNTPPEMADLWMGATANPSMFKRPLPHDFHPDPRMRRQRMPVPAHVLRDPYSLRNMLLGLKEAGLNVYLSRMGDPPWERGALLVRLPMKGRAQFVLAAYRDERGSMQWVESWDGNFSEAGRKRLRAAELRDDVRRMRETLKLGRRMPVDCHDLFGGDP